MDILTGTGRVGRLNYFATSLAISLLLVPVVFATAVEDPAVGQPSVSPVLLLASLIAFYFGLMNTVRRLHDCSRSGWMAILLFVPLVSFFFGLYLLFAPGDTNRNMYGMPPGSGEPRMSFAAQRQRVDSIAAAASDAYRAQDQVSYVNPDGSFNMEGLSSENPGLYGQSSQPAWEALSYSAPDPTWSPPQGPASK
jgi:uncharacterized membrane protein YhaH (DUF805 family)